MKFRKEGRDGRRTEDPVVCCERIALGFVDGTEERSEDDVRIREEDLREDLKRILALSPEKRTEEEERKIANAVLYGRREGHYDAKGFEVWDVGEMSEGAEGTRGDGEDDWEGEPVPWEAGEL